MNPISTRIAAFWAAWKFVVILASVLALSLYTNYRQWRRAIEAPLKAENKALTDWVNTSTQIANERATESATLFERLEVIDQWTSRGITVYQKAANAAPLAPNCAPGQARVDAVNELLGPQSPSTPGETQ